MAPTPIVLGIASSEICAVVLLPAKSIHLASRGCGASESVTGEPQCILSLLQHQLSSPGRSHNRSASSLVLCSIAEKCRTTSTVGFFQDAHEMIVLRRPADRRLLLA